jgi:bacterioferritin-associated ferredoxin
MRADDELCLCFHVSLRKVVNFCVRERPAVASRISECLSAGTGCGWCVPYLKHLHRAVDSGAEIEIDEAGVLRFDRVDSATNELRTDVNHESDSAVDLSSISADAYASARRIYRRDRSSRSTDEPKKSD